MPVVYVKPVNKSVEVEYGTLLADALSKVLPGMALPCGGRGFCGKCSVRVHGVLSPPTGNELLLGIVERNLRLACQARVYGDVVVEEVYFPTRIKPILGGIEPRIDKDPLVRCTSISLEKLPRFYSKVLEMCRTGILVDSHVLTILNELVSTSFRRDVEVDVCCINNRVWMSKKRKGDERTAILVVDIGTTKIAGYLLDVEDYETTAEDYVVNPQVSIGADVITRMERWLDNASTRDRLRELLVKGLLELVEKMRNKLSLPVKIPLVVVTGNQVEIQFLLNTDIRRLAAYPFEPVFSGLFLDYSSNTGISMPDNPYILVAPGNSGFIGPDAITSILVTETLGARKPYLLIDLGTNTEIVLSLSEKEFYATSAPAGPAFEGHLTSGVGGGASGITRVRIRDPRRLVFEYIVEGGGKPLGVTGSGYISLLAELLRHKLISPQGLLNTGLRTPEGIRYIEIVPAEHTLHNKPIILTQLDIRELQKAIAAVKTGWETLLDKTGLRPNDVKQVFIAGSFGSSISPEDLLTLRLIPPISTDNIFVLGNAAGIGAKLLAKNKKLLRLALNISQAMKNIEIAGTPEYQERWVKNLLFYSES